MTNNIEDRIVSIKFDNAGFEQKITQTMASLDHLTSKLSTVDSGKGFSNIQSEANNVNFKNMSSGIDSISNKLGTMGAVGFSVIQQLTQNITGFVGNMAKNDILSPILSGGKNRAQEIAQAQFQFEGLGLNTAEIMKNAKDAVLGTAYGLGDAAKAAAQFGASGIGAGKDMTTSLRAISGTAAITGTQFNDMATLFTQSAATGKVTNMDLQQFATRGLNAAAAYAKQIGVSESAVHDMATAGAIDYKGFAAAMDKAFGDHATAANQTYSGSLENMHAAMSRLGATFFGPELMQQKDLFNALTPVIDKVSTALGPLIYTVLSLRGNSTSGLINFLKNLDFSSLTIAMPQISQGLLNIVSYLQQFYHIAKTAFKDVFPASFGSTLIGLSAGFEALTFKLQASDSTLTKISDIFKGFFALLDIGWALIKGVATVVGDLFRALSPAGSGLLNMSASTGNLLVKLDDFLVKGGRMNDFFEMLGSKIAIPVGWIDELSHKIASFFTAGYRDLSISKALDQFKSRLSEASSTATHVQSIWDRLRSAFQGVLNILDSIWQAFDTVFHKIGDVVHNLFEKIRQEMQPADFNSALDAMNVGILGGIAIMIKKITEGLKLGFSGKLGFEGGVLNTIKSALGNVTQAFKSMQTELKAEALMKIAEAIALIAVSVVVLSLINSGDLTKALSALAIGFGELAAALLALDTVTKTVGGAAKLDLIAGSLIALASAMIIFALAIKIMSTMKTDELAKGLIGVGAAMAILIVGVNSITIDTEGLVRAGISIGLIAFALRILADAVKAFGNLSWKELGKGLVGVAAGLALIILAMNFMPAEGIIGGLGFVILAVGLRLLADAVKAFGDMSWKEIGKGLVAITGALLGIALAMDLMPVTLPITAFGVGVLAVSLGMMAIVLNEMGKIPFGTMIKAIGEVALTLVVLALGMEAMQGSLGGALALVIIAHALGTLFKVLKEFGSMSIKDIATGLGAIAATLIVLGLTAMLLEPAIGAMIGLGVALTLVGTGFALFGAGAWLAVEALSLMAKVGVGAIEKLVKSIPMLATAGADLLLNFVNDILIGLPTVLNTLGKVIDSLLNLIIKEVPKLGKALEAIVGTLFEVLKKDFPLLVQAGFLIIQALLDGMDKNIGGVVDKVADIFVKFANAVVDNMPQIVAAAASMIVSFLNELANHVGEVIVAGYNLLAQILLGLASGEDLIIETVGKMIASFIKAIGDAAGDIIAAGASMLVALITGIGSAIGQIVDAVTNIVTTFLTELGNHIVEIVTAGVNMVIILMWGISAQALRLIDSAAECLLKFLDGLDAAINKYEPQIIQKCLKIGIDILKGIFQGFGDVKALSDITDWLGGLWSKVTGWVGDIFGKVGSIGGDIVHGIWAGIVNVGDYLKDHLKTWIHDHVPGWIQHLLGIGSPSKVMAEIGQYIPLGLIVGIQSKSQQVKDTMGNLANSMVDAFNPNASSLNSVMSDFVNGLSDTASFNPTITPVLDLSKVKAGASGISGLMSIAPITADVSTKQAATISTNLANALNAAATPVVATAPSQVSFNQTINAPVALTTNEIYRNTKNQIVLAKAELGIS